MGKIMRERERAEKRARKQEKKDEKKVVAAAAAELGLTVEEYNELEGRGPTVPTTEEEEVASTQ